MESSDDMREDTFPEPMEDAQMSAKMAAVGQYAGGGLAQPMPGIGVVQMSYVERLRFRKVQLLKELSQVNEALDALKENPGIEKVIHAITRVGGLY